jgi:hypothetical protein
LVGDLVAKHGVQDVAAAPGEADEGGVVFLAFGSFPVVVGPRWWVGQRRSHGLWNPTAAAAGVAANPKLLIDLPVLRDPALYQGADGALLLLRLAEQVAVQDQQRHLRALRRSLLDRRPSAREDDPAGLLPEALQLARAYGSREFPMPSGYGHADAESNGDVYF